MSSIVTAKKSIIDLACGQTGCLAITSDGIAVGWGSDGAMLSCGWTGSNPRPTPGPTLYNSAISSLRIMTKVAVGYQHSVGLTNDGLLYASGINSHGEIGDATTSMAYNNWLTF